MTSESAAASGRRRRVMRRAATAGERAPIIVPIADRYYGLRDFLIADPDGFGVRFASILQR